MRENKVDNNFKTFCKFSFRAFCSAHMWVRARKLLMENFSNDFSRSPSLGSAWRRCNEKYINSRERVENQHKSEELVRVFDAAKVKLWVDRGRDAGEKSEIHFLQGKRRDCFAAYRSRRFSMFFRSNAFESPPVFLQSSWALSYYIENIFLIIITNFWTAESE